MKLSLEAFRSFFTKYIIKVLYCLDLAFYAVLCFIFFIVLVYLYKQTKKSIKFKLLFLSYFSGSCFNLCLLVCLKTKPYSLSLSLAIPFFISLLIFLFLPSKLKIFILSKLSHLQQNEMTIESLSSFYLHKKDPPLSFFRT